MGTLPSLPRPHPAFHGTSRPLDHAAPCLASPALALRLAFSNIAPQRARPARAARRPSHRPVRAGRPRQNFRRLRPWEAYHCRKVRRLSAQRLGRTRGLAENRQVRTVETPVLGNERCPMEEQPAGFVRVSGSVVDSPASQMQSPSDSGPIQEVAAWNHPGHRGDDPTGRTQASRVETPGTGVPASTRHRRQGRHAGGLGTGQTDPQARGGSGRQSVGTLESLDGMSPSKTAQALPRTR